MPDRSVPDRSVPDPSQRAVATGTPETPEAPEAPAALPMRRLHPAGLFSLVLPGEAAPTYHLDVQRPWGGVDQIADPYAFPALLTEFDLYLIGEGKHQDLHDKLGAHPRRVNGVQGVDFAVWAPNARRVSVVGDFNSWDDRVHPMRLRPNGIWELFIPEVTPGALYKFAVLSWNNDYRVLKADPFAFAAEVRPGTASRVWDLGGYSWGDTDWMHEQGRHNDLDRPVSIYEVHPGSWRPPSEPSGGHGQVSYRDLAHQLVPYVKDLGYTHIELMPVAEHPFDGSWGYQVTGYFAPTSRYGTPQDFMYFVDQCHQHGIGVLLDWVPAHFPKDEHGLAYFDGSHLYEHEDPRKGEHPDWGTLVFNFGRNEVRNFFIANALFWLEKYHIDGLRVDAVASMLYLDYSREQGQWIPNERGGRENLDAVRFLRECNETIKGRHPHVLTIAEESTAWPFVTASPADGGLGFTLKWNMGWMHDILDYFHYDPVYRSYHHNELTFSMVYAYSEKFVLPFSHDEVVHMKGSLLNKMPGDVWQKFANLRALYTFMYGHPGKKLLFMGGEFGQWSEWNFAGFLDWHLLDPAAQSDPRHEQLRALVRDLNALLRSQPALHQCDFTPEGFEWIDGADTAHSVISFVRYGEEKSGPLVFVCNFTPVPHYAYRIGVPFAGHYDEMLNSDSALYGGGNVGNFGGIESEPLPMHGRKHSLSLTLPPLSTLVLRPIAARSGDAAAEGETRAVRRPRKRAQPRERTAGDA
jgi:1,4-alpha-glucan branching enzyme